MTAQLSGLVQPDHTVVVTMECQRGVVGDLSPFAELVGAVDSVGVIGNGARLLAAARSVGVRVLHCTAERRADGAGGVVNCRMLAGAAAASADGGGIEAGTAGAELVPEFGPESEDLVVPRLHGVTPFTSTSLDQLIRNLGATTVVPVGVSLNIGVLGLCISAVDLGYQVVLPTDAVAGVPVEYGEIVLGGTLSLLARLTTVSELEQAWMPK